MINGEAIGEGGHGKVQRAHRCVMTSRSGTVHRTWCVQVCVVIAATFVESVAVGMVAVLFPVTLDELGFRSTIIVAVLALEGATSILMGFRIAALLRRVGSGKGLVLATLLRVGALVLLARGTTLPAWVIGIGLYGGGAFVFVQLLQTWIAAIPTTRRGLLIGVFGTAASLGMALGPLVLRLLSWAATAASAGRLPASLELLDGRGMFVVSAVISAFALVPLLTVFRQVPTFKDNSTLSFVSAVRRSPTILWAVAIAGITTFGVTDFVTLYGSGHGLTVPDAALMLSSFLLGSLVLEAPIASTSDMLDRPSVVVGLVLTGMVCAACLPAAIHTPIQAWALLFVWGGVTGGLYSVTLAMVTEDSHECENVAVNSAYSLMETLGGTAGTLAIGLSMDLFGSGGMPTVILFSGCLYLTYALYRCPVVSVRSPIRGWGDSLARLTRF